MPLPAKPFRPALGAGVLLLLVAAYLVVALNARFWTLVFASPGVAGAHGAKVVAAVAAALFALTLLMLLPLSLRWTLRPGLALVLLLSATAAFFVGDYAAVIDRHALASVYATDAREAGEWLSPRMLAFIAGFGALPAALLWWVRIDWRSAPRELWSRLKLAALAFALLAFAAGLAGKDVASLLRNRMELRHIANPFALLAANLSYLDHARDAGRPFVRIATDARRGATLVPAERPVVLVLAIGESLRAASLDLNGYARDTDVDLHPLPIVNFGHVGSCGTNTATSLPCMFSDLGRAAYDDAEAKHRENLLDAMTRGGYDVLWIDNNTGSKGLAARATEIAAAAGADPARCNAAGCHDEVLVDRLKTVLPTIRRDTVIVVHLLGSHGPAYHARYPAAFSVFRPECRTSQLQDCSDAQLRNSYDNSVLYTTHVLAGIASLLGGTQARFDRMPAGALRCRALHGHAGSGACPPLPQPVPAADPGIDAAMLFVSDHGESLGEKGLYLHGAPYAIAPDEQTHVPMLLWASSRFAARRRLDLDCVRRVADRPLSHDHVFHSVLALADVRTAARKPALDLFAGCVPPR
jgi:lipid A ethanolaminephosphotransferase